MRVDLRIVKSPQVRAFEHGGGGYTDDERQRDMRPGRFAVRGSFIDLSKNYDDADGQWQAEIGMRDAAG
jgi:hypothetical protein